jgi:hypothetical protein
MKTTSKIILAAFLIGFCGLGTHAAHFSLVSKVAHFSLVSAAEPTLPCAEPHFSLVSAAEPTLPCAEPHFSLVSAAEPTEMPFGAYALPYEQAMQILGEAHAQYWYDELTMAELVQRYEDGICTIEKVSEGYRVNGGGGLGIITVLDDF